MKPERLQTRIFLDSGDPMETKVVMERLGFLDGQTTNPSLVAKNPELQAKISSDAALTKDDVKNFYKKVVVEISDLIPNGSVSIEVYADVQTSIDAMLEEARDMNAWIPNGHIKFPTTINGLEAASIFVSEGGRANMTLVFSQEQAAAVYNATAGAQKGDIYLSPFVGRLDDKGVDGMSLIQNIMRMYESGDAHVEVLVASVRSLDHFLRALALGVHIITAPSKILLAWADQNMPIPSADFVYHAEGLTPLPFEKLDMTADWHTCNISHQLTIAGLIRFAEDWNTLIGA